MKVLITAFQQESNSFSPIRCGIDMFKNRRLVYGEDILTQYRGASNQVGAFLDVLEDEKAEIIPSIAAGSVSSGPVTEEAYRQVESAILDAIREKGPVDGVLLCLHGATMLEEYYDGAGRLLERVRQAVGDQAVIAGTLDFHSNVTEKMVSSANILVGYHTYPHVDQYPVGHTAATLLVKAVKGEVRPVMAMCKLPMIHQAEACQTGKYPFKKIMDRLDEMESREGVLSASLFQMQPWLDLADAGAGVLVIADGSEALARTGAQSLAQEYWEMKEEFYFELTPLDQGVKRAVEAEEGPVVLSDSADAPSAGSPGASTVVLSYLLENHIDVDTLITLVDPEGVAAAIKTGVGKAGVFRLGGKIPMENSKPLNINAAVKLISDGEFRTPGSGKAVKMGRTAVLKAGRISIVVMENPTSVTSPHLYRSVGLEPLEAKLVVVKSPLQFRENFQGIAKEIYVVDTPGASSSNIKAMPFRNLPRPMYPFDPVESLDIRVKAIGHTRESS